MAQNQPDVRVICGSLRKGSYNAALARMLPKLAPAGMTISEAPPYDGFPHFNHDLDTPADVTAFADGVRAADGIIFVSPEYNWTIPGAMKNALDWTTRFPEQPFKNKPVALQSVSVSPIGGTRMQPHLRLSLIAIDAVCLGRPEVYVASAKDKFDATTLELKDQPAIDLVKGQLAGFEEFIRRVGNKG